MGWGIPSGNHLLRIRPSWQDIQGNKTTWGDENQDAGKDWVSIIWVKDQNHWVAASQPGAVREFLGTMTGTARMEGPDLMVYTDKEANKLVFHQYESAGASVARHKGNVFRFTMEGRTGGQHYKRRTRFVRQVDMGLMTPPERLTEMLDAVLKDEEFGAYLKKEFGLLGRAEVLVAMAAVLAVFAGVVGGATAVGGAAFGAAVGQLLGVSLMAYQLKVYVDAFGKLQDACFSGKQEDFDRGKAAIRTILTQLLMDVSLAIGLGAAAKVGPKVWAVLKGLFTKFTPAKWQEAAQKAVVEAKGKVQSIGARFGYSGEHLFKGTTPEAALLRQGEHTVFVQRCKQNKEMIVIRAPSQERLTWLNKLKGWVTGKPEQIKGKSADGWHGLLGFNADQAINALIAKLPKAAPYKMGNLKGVFDEIDDYIAKYPTRPAYKLPFGFNVEIVGNPGSKVFDWSAHGSQADSVGYLLVDLGPVNGVDKYIVVDGLGRPICQDLDIAAFAKRGTPVCGDHLPASGGKNPRAEDNFFAQEMMNIRMHEAGAPGSMMMHGGAGGSGRHIQATNASQWTPLKNGEWIKEKLFAYLPTPGGGCSLVEFAGWAQYEAFCNANGFNVGFRELRASGKAMPAVIH